MAFCLSFLPHPFCVYKNIHYTRSLIALQALLEGKSNVKLPLNFKLCKTVRKNEGRRKERKGKREEGREGKKKGKRKKGKKVGRKEKV